MVAAIAANICIKGLRAPAGFSHPDRVLDPLKRSSPRGSGQGQGVSWKKEIGRAHV